MSLLVSATHQLVIVPSAISAYSEPLVYLAVPALGFGTVPSQVHKKSLMATFLPTDPAAGQPTAEEIPQVCYPEHCFHAFDTLFCELTKKVPIAPKFPDDK